MDKNEYKIKADEIKVLIAQGEYQQAAEIADSIDWRRVKSVMMLCTISDLYKINRRYEDSRDILLLAYDRHPGGRTIVYSLCELSIKLEEYVIAIEYYKEFVQIAPKDTGRYILQYKLYQAQDVSLEERIAVLEELKAKDYREKWAYELAYLYHRVGLATKCIEECDELILWFGEGKYVVKAMELKMLHQPLSSEQQGRYDNRFEPEPFSEGSEAYYQEQEPVYEDAQGQEYYPETDYDAEPEPQSVSEQAQEAAQPADLLRAPTIRIPSEEIEIQVKTMDVGQYNTINLQKELAEGLREVLEEDEEPGDAITRSIIAPMIEEDSEEWDAGSEEPAIPAAEEYIEQPAEEQTETEVFFGTTGEIGSVGTNDLSQPCQEILTEEEVFAQEERAETDDRQTGRQTSKILERGAVDESTDESTGKSAKVTAEKEPAEEQAPGGEPAAPLEDQTAAIVMEQLRMQNMGIEPPKEMAGVLSMESDGQISLVVPESEKVEKQITGQMRIEDILAEWERMKRDNEERRKEAIHQKVLRQTGPMFTAFEESIRDGLLEQLEQGVAPDMIAEELQLMEEVPGESAFSEEEYVAGEESLGEEEYAAGEETLGEEEYAAGEEAFSEEEYVAGEEALGEEEYAAGEEALGEEEYAAEEEAFSEEEYAAGEEVLGEEEYATGEEAFSEEEYAAGEEALGEEEYATEEGDLGGEENPGEGEYPSEEDGVEEPEEVENRPIGEEDSAGESENLSEQDSQPLREKPRVRALTREEKELFGSFIQSKSSREMLINAIDSISMASFTGNVVITGDEGMDTLKLAKNMIREVQMTDSNFSGRIAKISGSSLNQRDIVQTLDGLANGALIIQKVSDMNKDAVDALYKALQQEKYGLIVIIEDTRKAMNKFLRVYTKLTECFNARMDMEALSNDSLVAFGKKYAKEKEYSIDELGILALHTRIAEMQTSDHAVTVMDVKEILDEAIRHADRKSIGHFVDILLAKRYDEEDMIILRENDFIK